MMKNRPQTGQQRIESSKQKHKVTYSLKQKTPMSQTSPVAINKSTQKTPSIISIGHNTQFSTMKMKQQLASTQDNVLPEKETLSARLDDLQDKESNFRPLVKNGSRFRIAQPPLMATDISGKYWNKISNQISVDKNLLQLKLQQQRLAQTSGIPYSLTQTFEPPHILPKHPNQQHPIKPLHPLGQLTQIYHDNVSLKQYTTPHERNEFDQLQRPFLFLTNVGGKQTSQQLFTAQIDKNLLQNKIMNINNNNMQSLNPTSRKENDGISTELISINKTKNVQDLQKNKRKEEDSLNQTGHQQLTIFTNMNVDRHDFNIRERRKAQRAMSALNRPLTSVKSKKAISLNAGSSNMKTTHIISPQNMMTQPSPFQILPQRPVTGIPYTNSQKILPHMNQQQNLQSNKDLQVRNSDRRPFSANPRFLQLAGLERPFSAQLQTGKITGTRESLDDEEEEVEDEYVDLNLYSDDQQFQQQNLDTLSYSQRLMSSRPTTACKKELTEDMPFPELFDRSERTYGATFAKYGDLRYFTPIQRIGAYMDCSARLKRKHLIDLIDYVKSSRKIIKTIEEEAADSELAAKDYLVSCLFIGVMPEEDNPRDIKNRVENTEKMDELKELEESEDRVYDQSLAKYEGAFEYQKVWSETLINQIQLSVQRFFTYIESSDAIRNEEITKYKKEWMTHALDLVPDQLLSTYAPKVRSLFSEVFSGYARAMRQAIMEYILRSPQERKRLNIVMLPRPIPTAFERALMKGGFSTAKYSGCHQRKVRTEHEMKLRLLNNNIVTSALQQWFTDFRSFNLVEFRNLIQLIDTDTGSPGTAQYAMDIDNFLIFQEVYRQKVLQVLQHIWHRGCITIIKKFKFLRLHEDQQRLQHGKSSDSKWTFAGFNPRPQQNLFFIVLDLYSRDR